MWGLLVSQQDRHSEPPPPPSAIPFICWPLFSLIKGIQFPSVAWRYLVPDTSGSVMSSENEERCCWMQKKEADSYAYCQSVCRADARIKHSFVATAHRFRACVWIWLWLSCQALVAHPLHSHTTATGRGGGSKQEFALERTLVRRLSVCPHACSAWTLTGQLVCCNTFIHNVSNIKRLSADVQIFFDRRCKRIAHFVVLLRICRGCNMPVTHSTPNGSFLYRDNCWHVGSATVSSLFPQLHHCILNTYFLLILLVS